MINAKLWVPECWDYLPTAPGELRPALRTLLKERTTHRSIDETAAARRTLENNIVDILESNNTHNIFAILLSNMTVNDTPVPASGVLVNTPLDLSAPGAVQGITMLEAERATFTDTLNIQGTTAAVAIHDTEREVSTVTEHDAEVQHLWAAFQEVYRASAVTALPETINHTTREIRVWIPAPESTRTILIHFTFPHGPLSDKLTTICLETACAIDFRAAA